MSSLSSIRSALETRLDAVTKLQDVVLGRGITFSGFPACRYFLTDAQQELKDNAPSYLRSYIFTIQIIQEITQKSHATAEADFQDAVEEVLNGLSTNWTLGDNVDISEIQSSPVTEAIFPFGPCSVVDISFAAKTMVP